MDKIPSSDIQIDMYVFHYNEQLITPFVLNYWKLLPLRRVTILDNMSTDNSLFLIKQFFADTDVEVIVKTIDTNNTIDDAGRVHIRNNVWQESKGLCDFVIISDFDECVHSPKLLSDLRQMKQTGCTIMRLHNVSVCTDKFPPYSDMLLHNYPMMRAQQKTHYNKSVLFDPNKITAMNYDIGGHNIDPKGVVKWYDNKDILVHISDLGAQYMIDKFHRCAARLSNENKKHGWGSHYTTRDDSILSWFNNILPNQMIACEMIDAIRKNIKVKSVFN